MGPATAKSDIKSKHRSDVSHAKKSTEIQSRKPSYQKSSVKVAEEKGRKGILSHTTHVDGKVKSMPNNDNLEKSQSVKPLIPGNKLDGSFVGNNLQKVYAKRKLNATEAVVQKHNKMLGAVSARSSAVQRKVEPINRSLDKSYTKHKDEMQTYDVRDGDNKKNATIVDIDVDEEDEDDFFDTLVTQRKKIQPVDKMRLQNGKFQAPKKKLKICIQSLQSKDNLHPISSEYPASGSDASSTMDTLPQQQKSLVTQRSRRSRSPTRSNGGGSYGAASKHNCDNYSTYCYKDDFYGDNFDFCGDSPHPLDFYSETHEEQDPIYVQHARMKEMEERGQLLREIDLRESETNAQTKQNLQKKWTNQRADFKKQVTLLRESRTSKHETQWKQLQEQNKKAHEEQNKRISKSNELLEQNHAKEKKMMLSHHQDKLQADLQQLASSGSVIGPNDRHQLQREASGQRSKMLETLQIKQDSDMRKLKKKSEEALKGLEERYEKKEKALQEHQTSRKNEQEEVTKKLQSRFVINHESELREQLSEIKTSFSRERELVNNTESRAVAATGQTTMDSHMKKTSDASSMSFIQQQQNKGSSTKIDDVKATEAGKNKTGEVLKRAIDFSVPSGSLIRYKRRKTVLSGSPTQLAVEIHNEGIVIAARANSSEGNEDGKVTESRKGPSRSINDGSHSEKEGTAAKSGLSSGGRTSFIPWGFEARKILHSIICGEVPKGYSCERIDPVGKNMLQGGQIRCMVTDMRVSEIVASAQRSQAVKEIIMFQKVQRLKENVIVIEKKARQLTEKVALTEKNLAQATIEERECEEALKKSC